MRVMLLGAGGMLGRDLARSAPDRVVLHPFARAQLDITDYAAVERTVAALRPDVIVNAAAYTAVDRAETEADLAHQINGAAVAHLGRIAAASGATVIHFSTDYVFDGRARSPYAEDAPTNPINVYGASKLAGELGLAQSGARRLIIRTQWLFGPYGRSFPQTMRQRALARQPTRVVSDQVGRPTYTVDLAVATWSLVTGGCEGLYHVANDGLATWFDVAERIFRDLGCRDLLTPCRTVEYPVAAPRPKYSALSTARVEAFLRRPLPPWEDALTRFSRMSTCAAR